MLLRKLVAKEATSRSLAHATSREEHPSHSSAQPVDAPALGRCMENGRLLFFSWFSKDMEQNSEDAWGTKRSAEIHSGEAPS